MELIVKLLENILQNLPLIAEEGGYKDKISRDELSRVVKEQTLAAPEVVTVVLGMVELQFNKAGLLDPFELELGNWQFISFPASLVARSWLEVMSDKDGYWFPEGWWSDQANSEDHRELLKKVEELRLKYKTSQGISTCDVSSPQMKIFIEYVKFFREEIAQAGKFCRRNRGEC